MIVHECGSVQFKAKKDTNDELNSHPVPISPDLINENEGKFSVNNRT